MWQAVHPRVLLAQLLVWLEAGALLTQRLLQQAASLLLPTQLLRRLAAEVQLLLMLVPVAAVSTPSYRLQLQLLKRQQQRQPHYPA